MIYRGERRWVLPGLAIVLLAGVAGALLWGRAWLRSTPGVPRQTPSNSTDQRALTPDLEAQIKAFCGNCHALPLPERFPRDAWHDEVLRGYEFYARSGMTHLDPPPIEATVRYFRSRAPRELVFPTPAEAPEPLSVTFSVAHRTLADQARVPPAIAHIRWTRLQPGVSPVLVAADMRSGHVRAVDVQDDSSGTRLLARLHNPCHAEPCDLDQDGIIDLVVADLGSTVPYDHNLGRVVWLRGTSGSEPAYEEIVIASGLGRVADVRPGDLDKDGDQDLAVGVFGMQRTGQVLWLQNVSEDPHKPRFEPHPLDPRPGTIHVPVLDLDGDQRLDVLALISQEHECVAAYMNQGPDVLGTQIFHRQRIWAEPDLTFGSSGIEPVDFDKDGDVDVLYTNGDAFDNNFVNPSHGIQWLENLGECRFARHRLTDLVGAYRALPGDIDGDGDLDIVAVAWIPPGVKPAKLRGAQLPAIICLEQTTPGVFARHTLEKGVPRYPTVELADFDADGDLDFAVGYHVAEASRPYRWLSIWWNQRIP